MKNSRIKRSIRFILAVLVLFLTITEIGICSYAKEIRIEETPALEEAVEVILEKQETENKEKNGLPEYPGEVLSDIVPGVEVQDAYDKFISLKLSVPEDCVLSENEMFFYEVKVILNKGNERKEKRFLFEKEESNTQDVQIEMQEGSMDENEKWIYEIEVKLITKQGNSDFEINTKETVIQESRSSVLSDIEAEPYYEPKLTLKQKKTTVYTTQENVPVATVKFSKLTTVRDNLVIEDLTYNKEENCHQALTLSEVGKDYTLYVSADEDTAIGNHTIRVTADAPEGMYASRATIIVNVQQGIEEGMLSLEVPSDRFYKAENKNLSFTVKAVFTKDEESAKAAKTKKVTWEILSAEKKTLTEDMALYGYVTIKNGKVTINKNYTIKENSEENCFVIKAKAADFSGNTVCVYSDVIEITKEISEVGEAVILKLDENGNGYVTAKSSSSITADQLGKVVVFKKDALVAEKDYFTKSELENYTFKADSLSYKSSDNSIQIEKDGTIKAVKCAKNVKITVNVNDNSKQKAVIKNLSVVYANPIELGLKIEEIDENGSASQIGEIESENTEYRINTVTDSRLKVTVMQKSTEESDWEEADSIINYKLNVKNGTVIKKSGQYNQQYDLNVSKKNTIITLKDKWNKRNVTYTIINESCSNGKAPKLSFKGSLKAANYEKDQSITYTLQKNGSFEYDHYKKYVLIAANNAEKYKNDKNIDNYNAFEEALGGFGYQELNGKKFTLQFHSDKDNPLPVGKYKLWFVFGKLNDNGAFVPDTEMTAVTVNVQKVELPKGSYKVVTNYDISVKEGGIVTLKGSGKNYLSDSVEFLELKNANVKGSPNSFTDFFEIKNNKLILREDLTAEQLKYICSTAAKNNMYGYVDYKVTLGNSDGSYYEYTDTSKVNLTMKDSVRKFTIDKVNTTSEKITLKTKVYADNKEVNILFAYVAKGAYIMETDGSSTVTLIPKTGDQKPVGGVNDLTVYVVPKSTYKAYKEELNSLKKVWDNDIKNKEKEEAFAKKIKKYGIKVNVVVELPKVDNIEFVEEVVRLVNVERTKIGKSALTMDTDINVAAYIRSKELVKKFDHVRPDGQEWHTIFKECGITHNGAGENIAMGYRTPAAVVQAWMNSPGHKANILNGSYTHIGVGCYEVNGYYYWVQLFIKE